MDVAKGRTGLVIQTEDFTFGQIAGRYDLCNRLCSAGLDRRWRKTAAKILNPQEAEQVLDLCCGTGELAFALARHSPAASIIGLDISREMIEQSQKKRDPALSGRIDWQVADAVQTGLPSQTFDLITCAFGLRNIPDHLAALSEMHRLLRPQGRIGILEFSFPKNKFLRGLYWLYLRYVMPAAGVLLFARRKPLDYLAESIRTWNDEFDLPAVCRQAGLTYVRAQSLTCGIVTLHLLQNKAN
jgi:demethylmenaquinone methyltransferase/2-methoxy-6-polyprenyl-1,4-benzoquinol methylase